MKKIPVRKITSAEQELRPITDFKIRRLADIMQGKTLVHTLHRHDFFFVLAVERGSGLHEIDFVPYAVGDRSVFFLRPGQVHRLELTAISEGFLMEFNQAFYAGNDERFRRASNKKFCSVEAFRFERLMDLLEKMLAESLERETGYEELIRAALTSFFIEFIRQSSNSETTVVKTYGQERFEAFVDLLDQNFARHKQPAAYAELLNLSLYQLNELVKTAVGKTTSELITERIVLEAKRYLLATPNQVKDIADLLGYEDISYFIRFFKKQTGTTPELFRRNSA